MTLGGSGGKGGTGGPVTVNSYGTVDTTGRHGYGIFAQSTGGGGGIAHVLSSDTSSSASDDKRHLGQASPSAATAGPAATAVRSTVDVGQSAVSHVGTKGTGAIGVVAQSVGGGGGLLRHQQCRHRRQQHLGPQRRHRHPGHHRWCQRCLWQRRDGPGNARSDRRQPHHGLRADRRQRRLRRAGAERGRRRRPRRRRQQPAGRADQALPGHGPERQRRQRQRHGRQRLQHGHRRRRNPSASWRRASAAAVA